MINEIAVINIEYIELEWITASTLPNESMESVYCFEKLVFSWYRKYPKLQEPIWLNPPLIISTNFATVSVIRYPCLNFSSVISSP